MGQKPFWRCFARLAGGLLLAAAIAGQAAAASVTTSFAVTLTVVGACSVSATSLDFGTVVAGAPPGGLRAEGQIGVNCTAGTPFSVSLSPASTGLSNGHGVLGNPAGQDGVAYQLYRDGALRQPWGGNANGASGSGAGGKTQMKVYGWIPPGQHVRAANGTYADRVLVTVAY